jgi:pyruvate formate lyase activating enzyme
MKICGLQKLSMVDYPGKLAATVFTGGCNLRCPFCHNALLVTRLNESPTLDEDQVLSFLATRRGLLDGVVLSGGEPLLQKGVESFLAKVRSLGFSVKLDTNGCYPEALERILAAGLVDYVAMDVKSSPEDYGAAIGLEKPPMEAIEDSLRLLMNSGKDYELRITLVQELHGEAQILRLGQWLSALNGGEKLPKLFLQPFVNRDSVLTPNLHAPENDQIAHFADLLSTFVREVAVRG